LPLVRANPAGWMKGLQDAKAMGYITCNYVSIVPVTGDMCEYPGTLPTRHLAFNFPNTGYDLIDLLDLAIRECEPLDTADAIGLSARFEDSALS
jgi:hypothetical protein